MQRKPKQQTWKTLVHLSAGLIAVAFGAISLRATAAPPAPDLNVVSAPEERVVVSWFSPAPGFVLESTFTLETGTNTVWQAVNQPVVVQGDRFFVTLDPSHQHRFFRLRLPLTTIASTSPVHQETGVATIRETIVRFTRALGANVVLTPDRFFASYGGRRLLGRIELSSDRRSATLFYLEPLPGAARVLVALDGRGLADELDLPLDPDGDGQPGGTSVIAFDTLNLTPVAGTGVTGQVFAAEKNPNGTDHPLPGVVIAVDGREDVMRTTTDAQGRFTLSPVPAGRFFVTIDGRTSPESIYPSGAYYPYVGKAWDAVAGVVTNLAGGTGVIFLPRITPGTLQSVSQTVDAVVPLPAAVVATNPLLAGVSITVPANSLFANDGRRGGRVGIAMVPADRLPGPLPPGLELPLVITVQTDGAGNFDRPAPVCFPNVPDPVTGFVAPPGSRQALVSFNHKTGRWEGIGSMTVSADGKLVCTDPGVGIRQPGWHGFLPDWLFPPPPKGVEGVPPLDAGAGNDASPPGDDAGAGDGGDGGAPPEEEPPPCPDGDLRECAERGLAEEAQCFKERNAAKTRALKECRAVMRKMGPDDPFVQECFFEVGEEYKRHNAQCRQLQLKHDAECASCPLGPRQLQGGNRSSAVRALSGGPTPFDQVVELIDEMFVLIDPFASTRQTLPDAVITELDALIAQADALAGGDSVSFLLGQALESERQLAAEFIAFHQDLGNAPPYPVPYVANVVRPSGPFPIRGETDPFGQYQLFLPRDGTLLSIEFFDPRTARYGLISPQLRPEAPFPLPRFYLFPLTEDSPDTDDDALADAAEHVLGTNLLAADSDGDGVNDGSEVDRGSNPLDGIPARNGIVASADTPGTALDVVVRNQLAIVADGAAGVAIFDVSNAQHPLSVAEVDTPGTAEAVAASGRFIAVADGPAGLAIVALGDAPDAAGSLPALARIVHQVNLGGHVQAVTAANGLVFAGTTNGTLFSIDLASGALLDRREFEGPVFDIALEGETLGVATLKALHVLSVTQGEFGPAVTASSISLEPHPKLRPRLSFGGGLAYASHLLGYSLFDVDPADQPTRLSFSFQSPGWKQIVPTAAGLGLAAADTLEDLSGPNDIQLFDLRPGGTNATFVTQFPTPGSANAVFVDRSFAFVADGAAGLQVINFQAFDAVGVPPTITLSASVPLAPAQIEEGKPLRVTAHASDDVEVRLVEFYLDGQLVATDGSFPFEYRFDAPLRIGTDGGPVRSNFKLRARAIDTGGRGTFSSEITFVLLADTAAPVPVAVLPGDNRFVAGFLANQVLVKWNESIEPASLPANALTLFSAGSDGLPGTSDDVVVLGGSFEFNAGSRTAAITFDSSLPSDAYRAEVAAGVRDLAGNVTSAPIAWTFTVVGEDLTDLTGFQIAGDLEQPDVEDTFAFVAGAGQTVFFDEQNGTCLSRVNWSCVAPDGTVLFEDILGGLGCGSDEGLHTLPQAGVYTLRVKADPGQTNAYQFEVWHVPPPHTFNLSVGQAVTNGVPGAGAGNIETPGVRDVFRFAGTAGQAVYFDEQSGTCSTPLRWKCEAPDGTLLFDDQFGAPDCGADVGTKTLPLTGTYTLTVNGINSELGTYAFQLWPVPPPSEFPITVGSSVTNGLPRAGAGQIETPGSEDVFTFTTPPGQRIYLDEQTGDCLAPLRWQCVGPDSAVIFDKVFGGLGCGRDAGTQVLTNGGTYRLIVRGDQSGTGDYSFRISDVPPPLTFNIALGAVVSLGKPGPGAGVIETPGAEDRYRFSVSAGTRVYFDEQSGDCSARLRWRCEDSNGVVLFDNLLRQCGDDTGALTLTQGGAYTIVVRGEEETIGSYQFQIRVP